MKLYLLDPASSLARNITEVSRKLEINVVTWEAKYLDCMVVIANGTPDDKAFSIICHHLNGTKIAGIVKPPGRTGLAVINGLPDYVNKSDKIIILLDQEELNIDSIFKETEEKKLIKGEFKIIKDKKEERLKIYECKFRGKSAMVMLIVNGLEEIPSKKHTIEDHLLKGAEAFRIKVSEYENSKDAWNKLKNHHHEIFERLKEDTKIRLCRNPQQSKLKDSNHLDKNINYRL